MRALAISGWTLPEASKRTAKEPPKFEPVGINCIFDNSFQMAALTSASSLGGPAERQPGLGVDGEWTLEGGVEEAEKGLALSKWGTLSDANGGRPLWQHHG